VDDGRSGQRVQLPLPPRKAHHEPTDRSRLRHLPRGGGRLRAPRSHHRRRPGPRPPPTSSAWPAWSTSAAGSSARSPPATAGALQVLVPIKAGKDG